MNRTLRLVILSLALVLVFGIGAMCAFSGNNSDDPLHPTCTYEWYPCHPATTTGDHPVTTAEHPPAETTVVTTGEHPAPPAVTETVQSSSTVTLSTTATQPAYTLPAVTVSTTKVVTKPAPPCAKGFKKVKGGCLRTVVVTKTVVKIVYRPAKKCKPKPPPPDYPGCEGKCDDIPKGQKG